MIARALLPLATGLLLAGCTAVSGFPKPILDPKQEDAELAAFVGPGAIERYDACADKVACRNLLIDARVRAVDLAFARFARKLYGQEGRVSLGSDVLAMGLDSVAAVTGTKALAAGAGLVTGGRDAYEKQVLNVSLPLLLEQMIASRREVLVRIRQGQQMPVAAYTLFEALDDIGEYETAGSVPAAAATLAEQAGTTARTAEGKLEALRAARLAGVLPAATAPVAAGAPAASPKPALEPTPSPGPTPSPSPTPSPGPVSAS